MSPAYVITYVAGLAAAARVGCSPLHCQRVGNSPGRMAQERPVESLEGLTKLSWRGLFPGPHSLTCLGEERAFFPGNNERCGCEYGTVSSGHEADNQRRHEDAQSAPTKD